VVCACVSSRRHLLPPNSTKHCLITTFADSCKQCRIYEQSLKSSHNLRKNNYNANLCFSYLANKKPIFISEAEEHLFKLIRFKFELCASHHLRFDASRGVPRGEMLKGQTTPILIAERNHHNCIEFPCIQLQRAEWK
jgi:hypothetical protein